jgi:protein-L-isoaspartate(D-aspartate) O-methyltransferase
LTALEAHRTFFAELITAKAGTPKSQLTAAFAAIPREHYLGPGPWRVFTGRGYISTPFDDPTLLYQDIVVALDEESKINNGQPALHAMCIAALNVKQGETIVHIAVGTGYYTAVLAELVGQVGKVIAYEIDESLAQRATNNLADLPNVTLHSCSGSEGLLPNCHAIYINAGATDPLEIWLDALQPSGRLLFPLTSGTAGEMPGLGGMLLITRVTGERFDARFLFPALFIPCIGARDNETAMKLAEAFKRNDSSSGRSLRRKTPPDDTCWCSGEGWWLSTSEPL